MSEQATLTIAFRGLMVFHEDPANQLMEIGFLRAEGHIPRVLTLTNGVLANVFDLRSRPELDTDAAREWQIEVSNPVKRGASAYTNGSIGFDRQTHPDDRDFRWIMDFEAGDFYNKDLTDAMEAQKLKPVLRVPYGQFYTRLKSPQLKRSQDTTNTASAFGAVAGVTACDIPITGGTAELKVAGPTGATLFSFNTENLGNTIFEISNTPPDIPLTLASGSGHEHMGHTNGAMDHFQFYYDMFRPDRMPSPKFSFKALESETPAPDPFLCGKTMVGRRTIPL